MSDMTKAELEAKLRQAQDKICYCECKNKELQERLSAIVAPVQCDTYAEAVRAYGKQSQLVMAMEEMSELTKELSKNLRGAELHKEATPSPVRGGVILRTGVPDYDL